MPFRTHSSAEPLPRYGHCRSLRSPKSSSIIASTPRGERLLRDLVEQFNRRSQQDIPGLPVQKAWNGAPAVLNLATPATISFSQARARPSERNV